MSGFGSWEDFDHQLAIASPSRVAPLRRGVRRARSRARAMAGPSAPGRAAREPALRRAAARVQAPPRAPGAGAGASGARHARPGRDAGARRRPGRGDCQPRRLPRAARRASRGAGARGAHHRRLELGGGVHHPPPAAARRAARRPAALRANRFFFPSKTPPATARGSGRRRAAHESAARGAPGGGVPPAGAGPRRPAHRRAPRRPPFRARRPRPAGHARAGVEGFARPASRAARVRGDRLRQARRQGARLRLGPRHHFPVRRRGRARARDLRAPRAAPQHLAEQPHLCRPAVRHRPAAAPERRVRPAGVLGGGVPALPGGKRVGVGAPGADARALLRRRAGRRRRF